MKQDKELDKNINMNLHENIYRIKEVMGINESNGENLVKRRMNNVHKIIKSTYNWLNPVAFKGFDAFIERVIFSSTRDFIMDLGMYSNLSEEDKEAIYNLFTKIVMTEYLDEIKKYYDNETTGRYR
jgi:ABC-type transporter MlaC component